jgi:glycosyltransferase involved in cell wall biosynthesis
MMLLPLEEPERMTALRGDPVTLSPVALSVVIPCYNETAVLEDLYTRVTSICRQMVGDNYEFILVNDGSKDGTWSAIQTLADTDPNVVGVNLSRNFGHQLALTAGLNVCRGDRIFILDADLQDPPELLHEMMALMDEGADVVYGKRLKREAESSFKKLTAYLFYRLLNRMVEIDIPSDTGDFRLMSRRALNVLNDMPEKHRFIRGMVSWVGLQQVPVHYQRQARLAGETKYPFSKMLRFAIDAITGFSIQPLRAASYLGFVFGVIGILTLFYALYSWSTGRVVEGWTSIITVTLLLGSAQLFVLGIIGEYLGRLYIESKHRPLVVIDTIYSLRSRASGQETASDKGIRLVAGR